MDGNRAVADTAWEEKELQWAEFMAGSIFGSGKSARHNPEKARHTN